MIVALALCYVLAFVVAWIALCVWAASMIDDPTDTNTITASMLALIGAALWPVTILSAALVLGARWVFVRVWVARYGHLLTDAESAASVTGD